MWATLAQTNLPASIGPRVLGRTSVARVNLEFRDPRMATVHIALILPSWSGRINCMLFRLLPCGNVICKIGPLVLGLLCLGNPSVTLTLLPTKFRLQLPCATSIG